MESMGQQGSFWDTKWHPYPYQVWPGKCCHTMIARDLSARNIPWQSWPRPIGTPPWCVSVNFLFHKVFVGVVWVHLMWSSNSSFHVGLESRISQAEGFFPIRVLLCPFWLPYCLNVLGQISQSDCLCNVLWSSKFTSCIEADIRALSNKICNLIFITSTCMHWTHGGNNSIIKILVLLCEKFRDGKMLPTVG